MELGLSRNYRRRRHGKSPATRRRCAMRQKIRDLARRGLASRPGVKAPRWAGTAAVAALGLVIAIPASAMTSTSASAGRPAYLNASLPIQARAADPLGRMTPPENSGQVVPAAGTQ